jgi:RNA polymerase sigma-70 factor, ECF subfamily
VPQSFEALVEPLLERLALHVRRRAASVVGADCAEEDLVQTTLTTAWRLFPEHDYRGPMAFWSWLLTIADHAIADRSKYRRAKGREEVSNIGTQAGREPYDPRTSITKLAARRDLRRKVDEVLRGLDAGQREVVERHLLQGQSLAEIARAVGVTKNAVWERLQGGLDRLRAALDGEALP